MVGLLDLEMYTDGSSFIKGGQRLAGAVVCTLKETLWVEALPPGTSAPKAELWHLP